jgi:hypothetical protein
MRPYAQSVHAPLPTLQPPPRLPFARGPPHQQLLLQRTHVFLQSNVSIAPARGGRLYFQLEERQTILELSCAFALFSSARVQRALSRARTPGPRVCRLRRAHPLLDVLQGLRTHPVVLGDPRALSPVRCAAVASRELGHPRGL